MDTLLSNRKYLKINIARPEHAEECNNKGLSRLAKSNKGNGGSRHTIPYAKREKPNQAELLMDKKLPK